jgi:hypothetical protein
MALTETKFTARTTFEMAVRDIERTEWYCHTCFLWKKHNQFVSLTVCQDCQ